MGVYREITLTDGTTTRVYMPPVVRITTVIEKLHPLPNPPTFEQKTATGETVEIAQVDDPAYVAERARIIELRARERDEWIYLFALRDLKVPAGFDVSVYAELARLENKDWKPRDGERGRKLDYIEWEVLGDPVNWNRINQALTDMMTVDQEAVDIIEDSFRN